MVLRAVEYFCFVLFCSVVFSKQNLEMYVLTTWTKLLKQIRASKIPHATIREARENLVDYRTLSLDFFPFFNLLVSIWLRSQWHWVTCTRKASSTGTWSLRTSCWTTLVIMCVWMSPVFYYTAIVGQNLKPYWTKTNDYYTATVIKIK